MDEPSYMELRDGEVSGGDRTDPASSADLVRLSRCIREVGVRADFDATLETVLEHAQELVGFDHCALMLYEPETGTLRVRVARGYGARLEDVRRLTLGRGEGLSGWAAEHRQVVRVGNVLEDERYVAGLDSARSNLAVPLIAGNEVAGVLNVESEHMDAFSDRDEHILTVFGAQAALAILAHRSASELKGRIRQLDVLYRISQLASEGEEIDAVLDRIVRITEDLIPEGRSAILLLDEDGGGLRVRASREYQDGVEELRIPLGKGVTGRAAETGIPVVVQDVRAQATDYIPGVVDARSEIAVPLLVEGGVVGVLNVESTRPHSFPEEDVRTLSVIAQQAAAVVRAAQLYEETHHLAMTDPLTGLSNRRYFLQRLQDGLRLAARYEERLALLYLDLDFFKTVNDRCGHLVGDAVLKRIADRLASAVRESDTVARVGGDEFTALLPRTEREGALEAGERVCREVAAVDLGGLVDEELELSLSIGIGMFPEDGRRADELLGAADRALYTAKSRGRSRIAFAE